MKNFDSDDVFIKNSVSLVRRLYCNFTHVVRPPSKRVYCPVFIWPILLGYRLLGKW